MNRFPDTPAGACACLRSLSIFKKLTDVKCTPDPSIEGVWEVRHVHDGTPYRHVVYLGGYRDPFGRVRPRDDFETEGE